jgi:hypothetical protein
MLEKSLRKKKRNIINIIINNDNSDNDDDNNNGKPQQMMNHRLQQVVGNYQTGDHLKEHKYSSFCWFSNTSTKSSPLSVLMFSQKLSAGGTEQHILSATL